MRLARTLQTGKQTHPKKKCTRIWGIPTPETMTVLLSRDGNMVVVIGVGLSKPSYHTCKANSTIVTPDTLKP